MIRNITWLALALAGSPVAAMPSVPFSLEGPSVDIDDFEVTVFAAGLDFPLGMAELPDGSIIATVADDSSAFWVGEGKLIRLAEVDGTGIAAAPQTLYSGLSPTLTSVQVCDDLVFVTGAAMPLTILRMSDTPDAPLSLLGSIQFDYSASTTNHSHSALEVRKTPGESSSSYDLFFQLGASGNESATPASDTVPLSSDSVTEVTGELRRDAMHQLTLLDHGTHLEMTERRQVAAGLRNAAGIAIHPTRGDLYFVDNGIDTPDDQHTPFSADELNRIGRTDLGVTLPDFGFPDNYTSYPDGTVVGEDGIHPLMVFLPEIDADDPTIRRLSEGPNDLTFAPPGFPEGLNEGLFIGFFGKANEGGLRNDENPLVFANPKTKKSFHFIRGQQEGIGHLIGLLSTRDALYVADLATGGNLSSAKGEGVIYKIRSRSPGPLALDLARKADSLELDWERGRLYETTDLQGDWTPVEEVYSPLTITPEDGQRFFRLDD